MKDVIQKMLFFNSRAGRELWANKPRDVQDQDIKDREDDLQSLQNEIDLLKMQMEYVKNHADTFLEEANKFEAENKKLKAENKMRLINLHTALDDIKQAKIDVLNELKEKAISLSAIETYHICNLVDKMIEELKK